MWLYQGTKIMLSSSRQHMRLKFWLLSQLSICRHSRYSPLKPSERFPWFKFSSRFTTSFDYPPPSIIRHVRLSATLDYPPRSIIRHPRLSTTLEYPPPSIIRHPCLSTTLDYPPLSIIHQTRLSVNIFLVLMVADNRESTVFPNPPHTHTHAHSAVQWYIVW